MATTFTTVYGFDKPALGDPNWGGLRNTNMDDIDAELARPRIPFASPTVGATTTCDLAVARLFSFDLSQATTLAFTNVPATLSTRIRVLIGNGGAFTLTWPASVVWLPTIAGFSAFTPRFQAAGVDEVELVTKDGGTTWYASLRGSPRDRIGSSASDARAALVLFQNQSLQTTSTSEVSLASYSLPANTLAADGQAVRVSMWGRAVTQGAAPTVDFGGTEVAGENIAAGTNFYFTAVVVRTGAATQRASASEAHGTSHAVSRATPAETLSGAVTIDFRGSVTAGGTLDVDGVLVEYLAA